MFTLNYINEELVVRFLKKPKPIIETPIINDNYQTTFKVLWEDVDIVIEENLTKIEFGGFLDWAKSSFYNNRCCAKNLMFNNKLPKSESQFEMIGCVVSKISQEGYYTKITISFNNLIVPHSEYLG